MKKYFILTRISLIKVLVSIHNLFKQFFVELRVLKNKLWAKYIKRELSVVNCKIHITEEDTREQDKPIIFVSACVSKEIPGGFKYNGGIKMLNYLVKVLKQNGYEAYMVTYDGLYEEWLIEHQPHISIDDFLKMSNGRNIRCVTSWAIADEFIKHCDKIYFWDMELAYTTKDHFSVIYKLLHKKHMKIAGCNSMICAWHMTNWDMPCSLLLDWVDEEYWNPEPGIRIENRVGFMLESGYTLEEIEQIKLYLQQSGIQLDFCLIQGNEKDCLTLMQSCNIFLGMNHGKDKLWGEGFGLPMMEAMRAGLVVIAYDVIGNREFIHSGFNGYIISDKSWENMAAKLASLYNDKYLLDTIRANSINYVSSCHTSKNRWEDIKKFLDL